MTLSQRRSAKRQPIPKRLLTRLKVSKHYGPGPHPGTGTPQSIHGVKLLRPVQGEGTLKGRPVQKFLVNQDESNPNVSMDGLDEMQVLREGKLLQINADKRAGIEQKIRDTMADYDMTDESMVENIQRVYDSAMARYADNPGLLESDEFYEKWHEALFDISEKYDAEFDEVIAAASAISPGLDAEMNLIHAEDLVRMVDEDFRFEGQDARTLATKLKENAYLIRNPVHGENSVAVARGLAEVGDPRPKETSVRRLGIAAGLDRDANNLLDGGANLLNLSSEGSARAVQQLRQERFGAGFQPKTWTNFADAIDVLDGRITANESLGGIKTRSFYNNILDFDNSFGRDDVTVDFHTINFAAFGQGSDGNTHIQGTPSFESVGLGVRPAVADAVRAVNYRGLDLSGPQRVQEIVWAEWRRGTERGDNNWTSYDGTAYPLTDIGTPPKP